MISRDDNLQPALPFLPDGGDLGRVIRARNWSETPLGSPDDWPPVLRSSLALCLDTPVVAALFWGPDFRVLYNDAYALALAERHPQALAQPLRDVWPEIWEILAPQVQSVFDSGRGFSTTHQRLVLRRGNRSEETHWVYSFAPLRHEDGSVAGCYVTALETSGQIAAERERDASEASLRRSEEQLRLATEAAEVGLWDVDVVTDTLFWPARVKAMFGISPEMPVTMADFFAGVHPEDAPKVRAAYAAAADPTRRELYDVEYRTIGSEDGLVRWVAAKGRGVF